MFEALKIVVRKCVVKGNIHRGPHQFAANPSPTPRTPAAYAPNDAFLRLRLSRSACRHLKGPRTKHRTSTRAGACVVLFETAGRATSSDCARPCHIQHRNALDAHPNAVCFLDCWIHESSTLLHVIGLRRMTAYGHRRLARSRLSPRSRLCYICSLISQCRHTFFLTTAHSESRSRRKSDELLVN